MARSLRIEYEGAFYHVTARGNERRKIFFSGKDYAKFKEYIGEAKRKFGVILHAYVLDDKPLSPSAGDSREEFEPDHAAHQRLLYHLHEH